MEMKEKENKIIDSQSVFIYHIKEEDAKVMCICEWCKRDFEVVPSRAKRARFCSKGCQVMWWQRNRVKCICEECGKDFYVKTSRFENGRRFCSRNCFYKYQSNNNKGKSNPCWKGGKVKRICQVCGKTFEIKKGCAARKGHGRFCSRKCKGIWQSQDQQCKDHVRAMQKEISKTKTKPELTFAEICENNKVGIEYTGDKSLWVKNINPDFVYYKGRKRYAIFINGDYWHGALLRPQLRKTSRPEYQIKTCKQHKWIPIIIWETDLKRKDSEQFVLSVLKKERII